MTNNKTWKIISTIVLAKLWITGITVVGTVALAASKIQY